METIESVIFDWGGVLIDNPRAGLLRYCADAFGVAEDDYTPVHDSFLGEFHTGAISEQMFWHRISVELGRPAPKVRSLWYDAFRAAYVPRPEVFSLVPKQAYSDDRIALVLAGNSWVDFLRYDHLIVSAKDIQLCLRHSILLSLAKG